MRFTIITLFPEIFHALEYGIVGRALKKGIIDVDYLNPRDFTKDKHRIVDDRPYGGGPGMLLKPEPMQDAIQYARKKQHTIKVILLSPQGKVLDQAAVVALAKLPGLILVAGRYEGIDQRLIDSEIDEIWSIGDYVLSGGEFAALVIIDSITRLLPDVLGHKESSVQDSFMQGLLDHPHYTRPETFAGKTVPKILLSGDHKAIARWRLKQALGFTWLKRPDLLEKRGLTEEEQNLLEAFKREL